jgi:DNA-binding CsgD family transcriptional regulator
MGRVVRGKSKVELIIERLEEVRIDGRTGLGILRELREALAIDAVFFFRFVHRPRGWSIEAFESDGLAEPTRVRRSFDELLEAQQHFGWLGLAAPPVEQRNVAVCLTQQVGAAAMRRAPAVDQLLERCGIPDTQIVRVLLCENDVLRGWLGGFSRLPITEAQRGSMEALVAPLLVRMRIERSLVGAPRMPAPLEQTLRLLREPALLVDGRGRLHAANRAANGLDPADREQLVSQITAHLETRLPSPGVSLISVGVVEGTERFLAIMPAPSEHERRAQCAVLAGLRWQLTPDEVQLLTRLVARETDDVIARELRLSEQQVARQVHALLGRAQVTNRAQLVAAVLPG